MDIEFCHTCPDRRYWVLRAVLARSISLFTENRDPSVAENRSLRVTSIKEVLSIRRHVEENRTGLILKVRMSPVRFCAGRLQVVELVQHAGRARPPGNAPREHALIVGETDQ